MFMHAQTSRHTFELNFKEMILIKNHKNAYTYTYIPTRIPKSPFVRKREMALTRREAGAIFVICAVGADPKVPEPNPHRHKTPAISYISLVKGKRHIAVPVYASVHVLR